MILFNMLNFFRSMPKIELHAHLGGSIARKDLSELLNRQGYNKESQQVLSAALNAQDFFHSFFSASALAMSTVKGLKEVVNLVLQGFRKDNIIYLELRSSPKEGKDYNTTQYFETIIE